MTDHDRGAYTPQPDAPLQFDARGPRGRRPMPMTLIGSGVVLVVLLSALALHYRHDSKVADPARPVGEPIAQLKTAAPAAAQPRDAAGGVDVFSGKAHDATKAPTFAPPPEPVKPRLTVTAEEPLAVKPAPTTLTPAQPTSRVTARLTPVPTTAAPATTETSLAKTTVAKPDATSVVAQVAAAPVKPAATKPVTAKPAYIAPTAPKAEDTKLASAAPKAATAKPATSKSGAVVQIGAFSSTGQSDKGWSDVAAAMADDMSGKSKRVEALEKEGKTLYRTSVAGFATRAAADAFCKTLIAKGHICFAKG